MEKNRKISKVSLKVSTPVFIAQLVVFIVLFAVVINLLSGEQIVSMYKAVKNDNGEYIGLGGIGVFTSGLVDVLNGLSLDGMESAQYYLVNANTGEYIFHPDSEKISQVA